MAATIGQVNTIDAIRIKAKEILHHKDQMTYISGLWSNHTVNLLVDADIQAIAGMEGTSAAELAAARNAIAELVTAIGDVTVSGSIAYRLSRVLNNIP